MQLTHLVALLGLTHMAQAGLYSSSSPVIQVKTPAEFDSYVLDTNHTSIVEFYAPWCGHCKTLAPQFDKCAKKMDGLVNFVAVDCDSKALKPVCAKYGIKGYPSVKSFRRGKKTTTPVIEDYNGARNVKEIKRYAESKIRNEVSLINKASDWDSFLNNGGEKPRVVLVSSKATTSPDLLKSLAIDFIDTLDVAYVPGKSAEGMVPSALVDQMGKEKSVLAVWTSADVNDYLIYSGAMTKKPLYEFLAVHAEPREGSLRVKTVKTKAKKTKKAKGKNHDEL